MRALGGSTVRSIKLFASLLFVLGLSFASSVALAQQDQSQSNTGDPVADAARKAREQKKTAPKPKKVFTDDDIAPKPSPEFPAPSEVTPNPDKSDGVVAQDTTPVAKKDAAEKKEDPNSETA